MKTWIIISLIFFSISAWSKPCNPNSILESAFLPEGNEIQLETISTELRTMDKTLINDAQKGMSFDYWIDSQNQILFSEIGHYPKDNSAFIVLKDKTTKDGFVIKEWGNFHFDPQEKKFIFDPKNSWDLLPNEIDSAIREQSKIDFIRNADPTLQKSRVIKCTDLLAAQARGDAFIKDSLMISGYVTAAGFVTANPDILNFDIHDEKWQKKALLLASDLTGNLTSSYITGKVVKPLIVKNAGIFKDFLQRTATDLATNSLIKRPLYNVVNSDKTKSGVKTKLGNQLLPYDTSFGVVRFFPKRAVQRWTIRSLPKLLLSSCLKDSKLNLIVGPKMVRLADQYVAGYFYMSGRNAWMKHSSDEQPKRTTK